MRPSWMSYFHDMAKLVASRSKDTSTKVGCIIVSSDKILLATGYNGIPRRVADLPERLERPAKYLWTSHAEENAVAQAAREGIALNRGVAVVTHMPCSRCARMLIQAGISMVCVGSGTTSMPEEEFATAEAMFEEACVQVVRGEP